MSSKSKAGKSGKSTGGKAAKAVGPFVPEPLPPVTPVPAGTDPKSLPFLEWSDQELNSEKWDIPKAKDKGKQKPPPTMKKTPSSTPAQFPVVNNPDEPLQFVDPHLVHLPHSLAVHEWKRPAEVFSDVRKSFEANKTNFIMYKESSEYPDLISGSKHLLHSDFMRSFISAIGILEYLGNTRPSPIEFASPTFVPNTSDAPWRPWHHIYSMCKAGKGQKHNPQVNTLGKYVVRLFWMGCWRKIIIDDLLPIDLTKHVLLPTLDIPKPAEPVGTPVATPVAAVESSKSAKSGKSAKSTSSKKGKAGSSKSGKDVPEKKQIEMWPFLLCKALLKIASLTRTEFNEILDFDIVHCLTGWFVQKINVEGLDVLDVWDMCAGYSDHYTWPDPTKKGSGKGSKKSDKGSKSKSKSTSKSSKASKSSKSGKSGKNVSNFLDEENSGIIPYHLIATCTDMRTVPDEEVPDVSPCWSHHILIDQTRNVPLIKPDPLPDLARWKRFRWLAWAIRKGLWPAPELIPIKCFKMVSVFKRCAEHVVYKPPSKEAIDIKKSVAVIEELALEMGDGKKKGGKDKGKKGAEKPAKKESSKSSKSSKGSKDKKGKKGALSVPLPPDPSIWGDFNKLSPYIGCLYIFFKSSLFRAKVKITDIAQSTSGKDAGKGKADKGKKGGKTEATGLQLLLWNNELLASRNEPVYLFLDSIDYKLIVVNFAQVGNTAVLEKPDNYENFSESMPKENYLIEDPEYVDGIFSIPFGYVVIENYNWQMPRIGDTSSFLNTYGTKTLLVDIKPGRFILRIWIKSDTPFTINLMSDTPLVIGRLEVVLENMSHEPEMLLKKCHEISSSYGQLVQKFGTPQFTEGLISFCRSYLPETTLSKLQLSEIHTAFLREFLNIILGNCPVQDIRQRIFAIKVLFIDPTIKLGPHRYFTKKITGENVSNEENIEEVSLSSEDVQLAKRSERAAVTLQAFFKKLFIRKLKSLHNQSHKDYLKNFDMLKKIYTENFSISKRMSIGPALIRNFLLSNPDMCNLKNHYLLLNDLNSCIYLQHFTGIVTAAQNTWFPIARHIFYCNSPYATTVKICLFCAFPKYIVRVFDNDTNQEIQRFTNNTSVNAYNNNAYGYTVLCYGWSEKDGDVQWKLDFITIKQKICSLIIIPQITIHNDILKQNYRPNVKHIICRCLVTINRDTLVSFRLSVSYENVKLYFRCLNEVGQIFGEIYGTERVILPRILLKYVEGIREDTESMFSTETTQSISSKDRKISKNKLRSGSLARTSTTTSIKKRKHSERMSLDKYSTTSERKSRQSKMLSQEIVIKYKDTVYIIEGYVVDDSWPLNKAEWNIVDEVKARSLLGPSVTTSFDSNMNSRQSSVRRSLSIGRKGSDKKRQSSEVVKPLENPIWCLETISNTEDSVPAVVDTRREEQIRNIKRQWYEPDPGRYEKSVNLRETYLETHYLPWDITPIDNTASVSLENYPEPKDETQALMQGEEVVLTSKPRLFSQLLQITKSRSLNKEQSLTIQSLDDIQKIPSFDENLRTLKKPVSKTKMLAPLNLENYFIRNETSENKYESIMENEEEKVDEEKVDEEKVEEEEVDKHVKTPEEEEYLIIKRAEAMADFELDQECYIEDMQKYLSDQIATHKLLDVFYKECRNESKDMMQEAYEVREKVIDLIIEAEKAKLPPPAKDKGKGKGKGKADKKKKKK